MKEKKQNGKTKRNGNGKGKRKNNGEGMGTERNDSIFVLFQLPTVKQINVLSIDTSEGGLSMSRLSTLRHPGSAHAVGFGALGSKIFVIGGEIVRYGTTYPKDVFFCSLDCNPRRWKKGPSLNGGKPDPVVVTVNHKLYTLAGMSTGRSLLTEKIDPVFEVLDPEFGDVWTPLPPPPFLSYYPRVDIGGHTVIGFNIYLQVFEPDGDQTLYSFNVIKEEWNVHNGDDTAPAGSDDLILHYLRVGYWESRADVVDSLLYMHFLRAPGKQTKVFAYDLTASKHDEEEEDVGSESFPEGKSRTMYNCPEEDDYLVRLPVVGLNDVTDTIPGSYGFVTHLRDNMFCLFCGYRLYIPQNGYHPINHLQACLFEANSFEMSRGSKSIKRNVVAKILTRADWKFEERLGSFYTWCKIPSEGPQIHFQQPQFQHEGTSKSYQDDVAGKVVRNAKVLDDQMQELNISPDAIAGI